MALEETDMPAKQTGDARMDFRLSKESKCLIEQAAALSEQNVSDFATSTLLREARQIVEQHHMVRMAQDDFKAFAAWLDAPAQPIPAVTKLFQEQAERKRRVAEMKGRRASPNQAAG
jgi:uncharacterized protein (DUF1778 family)